MNTNDIRATLIEFVVNENRKFQEYLDSLTPAKSKPAKLTLKGQQLQDLVDEGVFGCNSSAVARAFSILSDEKIVAKEEEPTADMSLAGGAWLRIHEEGAKPGPAIRMSSGQWIRLDQKRFGGRVYYTKPSEIKVLSAAEVEAQVNKMDDIRVKLLALTLA